MLLLFFFQAEDGIRDLVRSRGLGDVYKRQDQDGLYGWGEATLEWKTAGVVGSVEDVSRLLIGEDPRRICLLYTSDAADERSSVDLGGRRVIKKKNRQTKKNKKDTRTPQ